MKRILILGGGKSSTVLIKYLAKASTALDFVVTVGDIEPDAVLERLGGPQPNTEIITFDLDDTLQLENLIRANDIIVSMLPAAFHPVVARECLKQRKNMATASYVSPEMKAIHEDAVERGLLFLNELGVDPGIDHMSAMKVIDKIKAEGGTMTGFESFTGGLLSPESEKGNPWKYKFTWNPRNVVLAGQGVAKFIQMGKYKYIPYNRLFRRTEIIDIPGWGLFEGYGNRDSLGYRESYGLKDIRTMFRGTLRRPGYCRSWNSFVILGVTDDTYVMEGSKDMTKREFINSFLSYNPHDSVELKLAHYLGLELEGEEMYKLKWLGIFDNKPIGLGKDGSPAQLLQKILEDKWTMKDNDHDMLVMWHRFNYKDASGEDRELHSSMVAIGDNKHETAMAKTVGLPLGIAVLQLLKGDLPLTGVQIPTRKELYLPILKELETEGIVFEEREVEPKFY